MKRTLAAVAAATTLLMTACGGSGTDDTATDPAPAGGAGTPEPEMIGDYPAYPNDDYRFDLRVRCFCPYYGEPVTITVTGGEVTDAVWATEAQGHAQGEPVGDEWLRVSIDDILREAADPSYDEVDVAWKQGADHPRAVSIDKMSDAMDDEITYVITNVVPGLG